MMADSLVLLTHPTWDINPFRELLADLTTPPQANSFQMQVRETLHQNPGILVIETNPLQRINVQLV